MDSMPERLKLINKISRDILSEMNKENPSVELIQQALDHREEAIQGLEEHSTSYRKEDVPSGEQSKLSALFRDFTALNKDLQETFQDTLDQRREMLNDASKQRKAEDGYRVLKKPDISYFK